LRIELRKIEGELRTLPPQGTDLSPSRRRKGCESNRGTQRLSYVTKWYEVRHCNPVIVMKTKGGPEIKGVQGHLNGSPRKRKRDARTQRPKGVGI